MLLPTRDGKLIDYQLHGKPVEVPRHTRFNRIALAAAHVVSDPLATDGAVLDWDATLKFRRHLLDLGLGVAEAMDTAQRGAGLDWNTAVELIRRTLQSASNDERERIFSGVGTDHLSPDRTHTLNDVIAAYATQFDTVQAMGGRVIMMASRALARTAKNAEDYKRVYASVLAGADRPVILHWLGEMFDPELSGYWGTQTFSRASATVLEIITDNRAKVDGIKISLLNAEHEIVLRRQMPVGVHTYTGDDFNYSALIKGDAHGYSHALLGIFDPIAPLAAAALSRLADGEIGRYDALMKSSEVLSRVIFSSPTRFYKTGIVFLAWLNGFQDHFIMPGGAQSLRPLDYFVNIFRHADAAGLLRDQELAVVRMKQWLAIYGINN